MQDLLTALAELIVFGFTVIFLLDLAIALNNCWIASAQKLPLPHQIEVPAATLQIQPKNKDLSLVLPDPWILPLDEVLSKPQLGQCAASQLKPLLLLPQVTAEPNLDELLLAIDIDKLQLRRARQIAKALGIAQKVNKKDQPISWLRAQIKAKLQQPQELPTTAILAVRELLAS